MTRVPERGSLVQPLTLTVWSTRAPHAAQEPPAVPHRALRHGLLPGFPLTERARRMEGHDGTPGRYIRVCCRIHEDGSIEGYLKYEITFQV